MKEKEHKINCFRAHYRAHCRPRGNNRILVHKLVFFCCCCCCKRQYRYKVVSLACLKSYLPLFTLTSSTSLHSAIIFMNGNSQSATSSAGESIQTSLTTGGVGRRKRSATGIDVVTPSGQLTDLVISILQRSWVFFSCLYRRRNYVICILTFFGFFYSLIVIICSSQSLRFQALCIVLHDLQIVSKWLDIFFMKLL